MNAVRRRRRKIHPCLFFERNESTNDYFPSESDSDVKNGNGKRGIDGEPEAKINESNLILLEQIKVSSALAKANAAAISKKRKKSPSAEVMAQRREDVLVTLNQRRDAICKEIEKTWFIEGAYLEKHRHNLQVTHELSERGLMWP